MEVRTFSIFEDFTSEDRLGWGGANWQLFQRRWPRAYGAARGLIPAVVGFAPDVIHTHGLWMFASRAALLAKQSTEAQLILSPHGMLTGWALAHSRWRKRIMWALQDRRTLERSSAFHATSEAEVRDLLRLGFRQPVTVIPFGVDGTGATDRLELRDIYYVTYVGRLHPKKGLPILLEAWGEVARAFPQWRLQIAGPDERGHEAELKRLAQERSLERVDFLGPVHGEVKAATFARADLFVLPTHSENFGVTVAEALSYGVPVICTKGAPWAGLEANGCGWWIDLTLDDLATTLRGAMSLSTAERTSMGERGRVWAERDFGWDLVARQFSDLYHRVIQLAPSRIRGQV